MLRPRKTVSDPGAIRPRDLVQPAGIVHGDVNTQPNSECDAVVLFDVLQMMPADRQDVLMANLTARLRPGGVMLVREANASAGWRFDGVRAINRFKAIVTGAWRRRFYFHSTHEWLACFERAGLDATVIAPEDGRPHANVLFRAVKR